MFTEKDIPYEKLKKFGVTQEMVDDFPQNISKVFLDGGYTPVIPIIIDGYGSEKIRTLAKVRLIQVNGTADLLFAPRMKEDRLSEFGVEEKLKLMQGDVIKIKSPDGSEVYAQYDHDIKQVMTVPTEVIEHNITSLFSGRTAFPQDNITPMLNGEKVTVTISDDTYPGTNKGEEITVGIDLEEETGIRIARGDARQWQQDKDNDKLPKYNFGLYGCWVKEYDGSMSYIPESNYTPEIKSEYELRTLNPQLKVS